MKYYSLNANSLKHKKFKIIKLYEDMNATEKRVSDQTIVY